MTSITQIVRTLLTPSPEITRMAAVRRYTTLFSQGQEADSLYVIEDGLVKLTRTNGDGDHIILAICGGGDLVGEEVLGGPGSTYAADAEVITPATVFRVPRETITRLIQQDTEFSQQLIHFLLRRRQSLAKKVELLCLHDVEYRILFYLAELSGMVRSDSDDDGYHVPITQAELARLIGATRETTSTTLNQLEKRGLLKLSRRLLTIPSPNLLRSAAREPHSVLQANSAKAH